MLIEKGLCRGISIVSKRHAKAKNPLVEGYHPERLSSHIFYLNANTFYGWAMSQYVPTGGFRWVDDASSSQKPLQSNRLTVPRALYSRWTWSTQKTYTTCKMHIRWHRSACWLKKWMSEYQHNLLGVGVAPTEVEKLVPNLHNKDCYVLHYRNLQLYMSLGMRLANVHRVLRFDQSPAMELYIRMNTGLRKKAASDFGKNLYKLMNNSVFGKTMENLRKRVDVKLVRSH